MSEEGQVNTRMCYQTGYQDHCLERDPAGLGTLRASQNHWPETGHSSGSTLSHTGPYFQGVLCECWRGALQESSPGFKRNPVGAGSAAAEMGPVQASSVTECGRSL